MVKPICKGVAIAEGGSVSTVGLGLLDGPTSPTLGEPNPLVIDMYSSDNPTTITIFVSYDNGTTWRAACVRGTDTPVSMPLDGDGVSQAVEILLAPNVKIVSSAACRLTAYAYISTT